MDRERWRELHGGREVGVGYKDRLAEVQRSALGRRRANHFFLKKEESRYESCSHLV